MQGILYNMNKRFHYFTNFMQVPVICVHDQQINDHDFKKVLFFLRFFREKMEKLFSSTFFPRKENCHSVKILYFRENKTKRMDFLFINSKSWNNDPMAHKHYVR